MEGVAGKGVGRVQQLEKYHVVGYESYKNSADNKRGYGAMVAHPIPVCSFLLQELPEGCPFESGYPHEPLSICLHLRTVACFFGNRCRTSQYRFVMQIMSRYAGRRIDAGY